MVGSRILSAISCGCACACAQGQISENTTLETYFSANNVHRGLFNYLSWGETNVRFNNQIKATLSGLTAGGHNSYDEACVAFEKDDEMLRVGRIKTAFGFSAWSDEFYNGFNHIPLVRTAPLANNLALTRDDAGAEATFGGPAL